MGIALSFKHRPSDAVARACEVVVSGGVIVYPTKTVYGVGGDATNPEVATCVRRIKQSADNKPMLVLTDEWERVLDWIEDISGSERLLMQHPDAGSLTLLFSASRNAPWAAIGDSTMVGIRRTIHPFCRSLIAAAGVPLISTSANTSGHPPPVRFDEIESRLIAEADLAIDNGVPLDDMPSTVVRAGDGGPVVLREGKVSEEQIKRFLSRSSAKWG